MSVDYHTADGTAQAPADYTATTGTLTFAPGRQAAPWTSLSSVTRSTRATRPSRFALTAPTGATVQDGVATGTIQDDEALPPLSVNDASVVEGGSAALASSTPQAWRTPAAELDFRGRVAGRESLPVTVHFATDDGTAHAPADYQATSGDVTFAPGQTLKTVAVPVNDDQIDENDETLELELSAPVNATLARSRAIGTIQDDDAPPAVSIADTACPRATPG